MKRIFGRKRALIAVLMAAVGTTACSFHAMGAEPPRPVEYVDLERLMGPWYVISSTPTFIDKESFNAIEEYTLTGDGTIQTKFSFFDGGFDGPLKTYHPKGFVKEDGSNAVWGMQFVWPIKADYQIVYLNDDYSRVIVAREKRDLVWLMAREPSIPDDEYQALLAQIVALGYEASSLRLTPQKWD